MLLFQKINDFMKYISKKQIFEILIFQKTTTLFQKNDFMKYNISKNQ